MTFETANGLAERPWIFILINSSHPDPPPSPLLLRHTRTILRPCLPAPTLYIHVAFKSAPSTSADLVSARAQGLCVRCDADSAEEEEELAPAALKPSSRLQLKVCPPPILERI